MNTAKSEANSVVPEVAPARHVAGLSGVAPEQFSANDVTDAMLVEAFVVRNRQRRADDRDEWIFCFAHLREIYAAMRALEPRASSEDK